MSLNLQVALTDEQLEKMAVPSGELIAVEGTKLKISRKLYAHTEMIKKNAVRLVSCLNFFVFRKYICYSTEIRML